MEAKKSDKTVKFYNCQPYFYYIFVTFFQECDP